MIRILRRKRGERRPVDVIESPDTGGVGAAKEAIEADGIGLDVIPFDLIHEKNQ